MDTAWNVPFSTTLVAIIYWQVTTKNCKGTALVGSTSLFHVTWVGHHPKFLDQVIAHLTHSLEQAKRLILRKKKNKQSVPIVCSGSGSAIIGGGVDGHRLLLQFFGLGGGVPWGPVDVPALPFGSTTSSSFFFFFFFFWEKLLGKLYWSKIVTSLARSWVIKLRGSSSPIQFSFVIIACLASSCATFACASRLLLRVVKFFWIIHKKFWFVREVAVYLHVRIKKNIYTRSKIERSIYKTKT